jgi:hypothetical protein
MAKRGGSVPSKVAIDQIMQVAGEVYSHQDYNRLWNYVADWWVDEDKGSYYIGCPDQGGRPALIFAVEAAKHICGMDYSTARALLSRAMEELDKAEER